MWAGGEGLFDGISRLGASPRFPDAPIRKEPGLAPKWLTMQSDAACSLISISDYNRYRSDRIDAPPNHQDTESTEHWAKDPIHVS